MDLTNQLVGLAILVGLVGMVVPVVPGSLLIGVAVLLWALDAGQPMAWVVFAVVVVLLAAGWSATYVVAGRRVSAAGVPRRSLVVAGIAGIVGFFVLPVVGLLLAFPMALYAMERLRLGDSRAAWTSALVAVKATALGMLIELGLGCAAAATWLVAVLSGVGR